MQISDILAVVIGIFAVYGFYALTCRILARFCYKGHLAVAVLPQAEDGEEDTLAEDLIYAQMMTEGERGRMGPPVILLNKRPAPDELPKLRAHGYALYIRL